MKTIKKIALFVTASILLVACHSEPTLQKYYVENQDNQSFVVLDLPSSLFLGDNSALPEEDQKTLQTIKKANILAFPITGENMNEYEQEKTTVESILSDAKYKTLMRIGVSGKKVKIMYLGDSNAIDEVIVYGNDDNKGFAIARILGNDMNIGAMMKLMKSAKNGDLNMNISAFGDIGKMIKEKQSEEPQE